jgi:hypothetical protein
MQMKKFWFGVAAVALLGLAAPAQAGFLDTLVKGQENQYEDESREHIFYQDGTKGLQVGDVIVSFVRINDRSHPAPGVVTINTIYGVSSITITSISPDGKSLTFGATPTGNAESLQSILGPGSGISAGAMLAVYDRPQGNDFPNDLINTSGGNANINQYVQQIAANGTLQITAGIVAANDFWNFTGAFTASSLTAATVNMATSGVTLGNFTAGLSIIDNNTGINFANDVIGQDLMGHQLVITKGAVTGGSNNSLYNTFGKPGAEDNATFLVHPQGVSGPEPASMLLMGMGIAGMAGCGWLRRKKAVTPA